MHMTNEDILVRRFEEEINPYFIQKVADQIDTIGELNPSSVHILTGLVSMTNDPHSIIRKLAADLGTEEYRLTPLFQQVIEEGTAPKGFDRYVSNATLSNEDRDNFKHFTNCIYRATSGEMNNLASSSSSAKYIHALDNAILATSMGLTDYNSARMKCMRELGYGSMVMQQSAEYYSHLDTSLRNDIHDGLNQIAQCGADINGEKLGCDAVEISAHGCCAPDHEPIQGRVFIRSEFEKLQLGEGFQDVEGRQYHGINRAIGHNGCMHIAMPVFLRYGSRSYSDSQLNELIEINHRGCKIDGTHYTKYEAMQLMRGIEEEIRNAKYHANAARLSGNATMHKEFDENISSLYQKYHHITKESGLRLSLDRCTIEGYHPLNIRKPRTKGQNSRE